MGKELLKGQPQHRVEEKRLNRTQLPDLWSEVDSIENLSWIIIYMEASRLFTLAGRCLPKSQKCSVCNSDMLKLAPQHRERSSLFIGNSLDIMDRIFQKNQSQGKFT